ncbi:hypothetical protein KHA80_02670 [Anaerobacillus sp. HL2]|nr:hypothetical protein KHA80_02670 [Anaerobacillus sp. HL2]
MKKCLLVGAGKGGTALLTILIDANIMEVIYKCDKIWTVKGLMLAKIVSKWCNDWRQLLTKDVDVVVEATEIK